MKNMKKIFAFGAVLALFAQGYAHSTVYNNGCEPVPPACPTNCPPEMETIKNPGASTGPILNNGRCVDFGITAEFLYWQIFMSDLPAIEQYRNLPNSRFFVYKLRNFDFDYKPTFRVGFNTLFHSNGWDLSAFWTYVYSTASISKRFDNLIAFGGGVPSAPSAIGTKATSAPFITFSGDYGNTASSRFSLYS